MNVDFGANKTPVEVIKEGTFGQTYFRDIYSGVNSKWYRKSWKEFGQTYFRDIHSGVNSKWYRKPWKEFDELGDIDQKYYCSNYYDVSVNKQVLNVEHY